MLKYATLATLSSVYAAKWAYDMENHDQAWGTDFCVGEQQSPIDITHYDHIEQWQNDDVVGAYDLAACINKALVSGETVLTNNYAGNNWDSDQHAFQYNFSPEPNCNGHKVAQFHFHFSSSEHTINGMNKFAEVHYVTYSDKFDGLLPAVLDNKPGNLAVLGWFIEQSDNVGEANDIMSAMIDDFNNAPTDCGDKQCGSYDGSVSGMLQPDSYLMDGEDKRNGYYRYDGGLTTPACFEVVTWTVFNDPIYISQENVDAIMQWKEGYFIGNNRFTQPLFDRQITWFGNPDNKKDLWVEQSEYEHEEAHHFRLIDDHKIHWNRSGMCLDVSENGYNLVIRSDCKTNWGVRNRNQLVDKDTGKCVVTKGKGQIVKVVMDKCRGADSQWFFDSDNGNVVSASAKGNKCLVGQKNGRVYFGYCQSLNGSNTDAQFGDE